MRDTRGAENVVEILGDAGRRLEYLVSDGYSGYGSGLEELERRFGIRIKSARCLTHARRPLHRFLDSAGLLKIYRALLPRGSSMADFPSSLEKYCKTPEGARLDGLSRSLLSIYYLINCLFAVDGAVVRRHQYQCQTPEFKADLLKARREKSLPIADALFDAVRLCILGNPGIVETRLCGDGSVRFKALPSKPQGRALIYLLNFEEELRRFIESAEVELSQSAAERSLKLGICSRKSFMYIQSDDGAQAFADFQTIANTCALNRVPLLPYLLWLSASVRLRLLQAQRSGADMEGAYAMPHKQRATGPDGKPRTIGMYSEEAEWGADRISALFGMIGANVTFDDAYVGWSPNPQSKVLKVAEASYRDLFGKEAKVEALHAGLETGLFLEKMPHLDMISFGPTLKNIHSPSERANIQSVAEFYRLLKEIITRLAN